MYRLRPRAKKDIDNIYKHTRKSFGEQQADKYHGELYAALRKLDETPNLGRNYDGVKSSLKGYRVKAHVIFFRRERQDIIVSRILHKSMDYQRHL